MDYALHITMYEIYCYIYIVPHGMLYFCQKTKLFPLYARLRSPMYAILMCIIVLELHL